VCCSSTVARVVNLVGPSKRPSPVYHSERPFSVQHDGREAARRAGLSTAAESCKCRGPNQIFGMGETRHNKTHVQTDTGE